MNINKSSGYIGLGSRLFLGDEGGSWSTKASTWELYNIYNQEGSRPQKVTTPIEVSQLYPSIHNCSFNSTKNFLISFK